MIEADFYLRDSQQKYLPAAEWNAEIATIFARDPQYYDEVKARIEIRSDGKACHTFDDNLGPILQNLCLRGALHIRQREDYDFRIWSYASEVQIRTEEELTTISGEHCGTASYPTQELADALLRCARRAIDFLMLAHVQLPETSPRAIENLEKLYANVQETAQK